MLANVNTYTGAHVIYAARSDNTKAILGYCQRIPFACAQLSADHVYHRVHVYDSFGMLAVLQARQEHSERRCKGRVER